MNKITVEELQNPQIEELSQMAADIWREHYIPINGEGHVEYMLDKFQSPKAIREQIADGYLYFHLKYNGENSGYMAVQPREGELFLSKIYVKNSFRQKGIAKTGFLYAAEIARRQNLGKITLTVNKHNDKSILAYKKLGFNIVKSAEFDIGNGYIMDDYIMEYLI